MNCANSSMCVRWDPHTQTPALVDGCPLCASCLDAAERDVRALVLDYRDLAQLMPRGPGALGTHVGGTADPTTPLRLPVDELQRDVAWTLTVWEPPVREAAGLPPGVADGVAVRAGWAVSQAVRVIAPRVALLAGLPPTWGRADGLAGGLVERDGVYAVASLRGLHRRARSMLGLSRLVLRLPGECADCGAMALERENGSDTVSCAVCGFAWTFEDYRRYVGMVLAAMPQRAA